MSKTKAELVTENKRLKRENEILRDQVNLFLHELDAEQSENKIIRKAHRDTVDQLAPLVDTRTKSRTRKEKHKTDSGKGGKGHHPLKYHQDELLKIFYAERAQGVKRPNKSALADDYISDTGIADVHHEALRKSLPKHE